MNCYGSLKDNVISVLPNVNTLKCDVAITYQMNINHYQIRMELPVIFILIANELFLIDVVVMNTKEINNERSGTH